MNENTVDSKMHTAKSEILQNLWAISGPMFPFDPMRPFEMYDVYCTQSFPAPDTVCNWTQQCQVRRYTAKARPENVANLSQCKKNQTKKKLDVDDRKNPC